MDQVLIAEAFTGQSLGYLSCEAFTWERALSAGSQGQATLVYEGSTSEERAHWRNLTQELTRLVVFERHGRVEFIGYVGGDSYTQGASKKTVKLYDLWTVLGRRGSWDHSHPNVEKWSTTVTGTLAWHASQALVRARDTAPALPNAMLPLNIPGQSGGATISRAYYGYHLEYVTDVWDDLMAEGLDIYLRPEYQTTQPGVQWRFFAGPTWNTGVTHEFVVTADDSPVSEFSQERDALMVTNNARWYGEGSEVDLLLRSNRNTASPYPLLDRVSGARNVTDPARLTAMANTDLVTFGAPTREWSFKVLAESAPDVGDTVRLYFEGDLEIADGWYSRRVVRVKGDLSRFVTVTLQ